MNDQSEEYDSEGNYVGVYGKSKKRGARTKEDQIYGNMWDDDEPDRRGKYTFTHTYEFICLHFKIYVSVRSLTHCILAELLCQF